MHKRNRILLVEDDKVDQMAFERFVKHENLAYDYTITGSVTETRQTLTQAQFDAVLIDYSLADGTAFDLLDEIENVPVIIVTGNGDEHIAVRAMKAGATDYLIKDPAGNYLKTLPVTVENAIRLKQTEEELRQHRDHLKELVTERTAELAQANEQLLAEIAERERAEKALQTSEQNYRTLVESSLQAITIHQDNRIVFVNHAAAEILGYTADELLALSPEEVFGLVHPEDRATVRKRLQERLAGKETSARNQYRSVRKDGTVRWLEVFVNLIEYDGKSAFLSVAVDTTERKRAELLLQTLNQVALAMEQALTPDKIFTTVAEAFKKINFSCVILLLDESKQKLLPQYVSFENSIIKAVEKLVGLKLESFSMPIKALDTYKKVILEKQSIFDKDAIEAIRQVLPKPTKKFAKQVAEIMHIPQFISAPLIVDDEVIGLLSVQSADLEENDIPSITAFAHQVAAVWRKAQLFEQAQREIVERKQAEAEVHRRNRELALLNQVIAGSAASHDIETVLETACRELAQAFDLPQATAILLNEQKTMVTVVAEYVADNRQTILNLEIQIEGNPIAEYILANRVPLAMSNVQDDPRLAHIHDLLQMRGTISMLILPLINEQDVIGGLILGATEVHSFSTEEVELAQSVADQVTGALARIQLDQKNKQLEEQYRQSQKMEAIGRLAGGMAHDFNNLLTVITGYSELLLHRHFDQDSSEYKDIEQISRAGKRATSLTRQLLAFSRQQMIQPEILNLNTIIEDMNQMLRRLISENIDLIITLAPSLGQVRADPGQIEQIIMNLAINAYDAMPEGGKLTIKTANTDLDEAYADRHLDLKPGSYVMLAISDTGSGMDTETQSHIFEPFFTTKEKGKGTGLGLATVYGIVQQNEGHISVFSKPGHGSSFQVYLPRIDQSAKVIKRQASAKPLRGTETILLVEDEDMVREIARYALLQNGYKILEASHGQEALEIFEQYKETIHLLLTDVVMPGGLSGRELAERLTVLRPEMKVLYMSGYTDDAIVHHSILNSAIIFLQKPFTPTALSRKVREVLDGPGRK